MLVDKPNKCRIHLAADFSAHFGMPLLAVLDAIMHIEGYSDVLDAKIRELEHWYEETLMPLSEPIEQSEKSI
jgi:hypothetical protein